MASTRSGWLAPGHAEETGHTMPGQVILVPGVIALVGGAGIARAAGPSGRRIAIIALVLGGACVAATVWVISLFASIGR